MQMIVDRIYSSGATTVEAFRQQRIFWGLPFAVVTFVPLNCPAIVFEPLVLSYRLADQALLVVGLISSFLQRKSLRIVG